MIRVGTIKYVNGKKVFPKFKNFKRIEVMTPSTEYGELGPYSLKNDENQIMENIWQFSKVYKRVPSSKQRYSRYNSLVIWDHPAETHLTNGKPNQKYFAWREKGMNNEHAVRYPVGYSKKARSSCLYALWEEKQLDYIEARKKIYFQVYSDLVKKQKKFQKLKQMLAKGENLLILEIDGPRQESLKYYQEKYNVNDDFITNNTIEVTLENMKIMLNDTKHAFGHGYCLAMTLLDMSVDD
jgi:hypothetical protein